MIFGERSYRAKGGEWFIPRDYFHQTKSTARQISEELDRMKTQDKCMCAGDHCLFDEPEIRRTYDQVMGNRPRSVPDEPRVPFGVGLLVGIILGGAIWYLLIRELVRAL